MESRSLPKTASRRFQLLPHELASTLRVCESMFRTCLHCAKEVATEGLLVKCKACGISIYCSDSCRKQDLKAHKGNESCQDIEKWRHRFKQARLDYNKHGIARRAWYRKQFPTEFNGDNSDDLIAGRYSQDPFWKPILDCQRELALKRAKHPTSARAVEESLGELLSLKWAVYLSDPYNLDALLVSVLLKLYREDDAVSLIVYWLEWRSRGPDIANLRDNAILNGKLSLWPFPITKDSRLADLSNRFRSFPAQQVGATVPIEFALAVLVIKMRFIVVYLSRAMVQTLFLYLNEGGLGLKLLRSDHKAHILSFLVEGGRGRYLSQLSHVNRLLDYIDERDGTVLPALIDPATQARRHEDQINFETYLQDYANGRPVIRAIKSMLVERYSCADASTNKAGGTAGNTNKNNNS